MQAILRIVCPMLLLLALHSMEAHAQLCIGDQNGGTGLTFVQSADCRGTMSANMALNHHANHPGCTGLLSISLSLSPGSCTGNKTAANAISTTSSAYHTLSHSRVCAALSGGNYFASATFKFNDQNVDQKSQNAFIDCVGGGGGACNDCTCKTCTPIVIDLRGRGFWFSNAENGVLFRLAGTGAQMNWVGWPLNADNAWLVLDRNGDGLISDGSEFFGNATPLVSGGTAEHGYEALAELDVDGDGWITAADPSFLTLRLWTDVNRNGFSEPSELHALSSFQIEALATGPTLSEHTDRWGNRFVLQSRVRFAGSAAGRKSADVIPVAAKAP